MGSKRKLYFLRKSFETRIGTFLTPFWSSYFLVNCLFIHPSFASFCLLVEVILWVFKGYPASIATSCYEDSEDANFHAQGVAHGKDQLTLLVWANTLHQQCFNIGIQAHCVRHSSSSHWTMSTSKIGIWTPILGLWIPTYVYFKYLP